MTHIKDNPIPKLHEAPQPPLSYPGATPDADRAKRPPLGQPWCQSGAAGAPRPTDAVSHSASFLMIITHLPFHVWSVTGQISSLTLNLGT
jgi:hypothetical protein